MTVLRATMMMTAVQMALKVFLFIVDARHKSS